METNYTLKRLKLFGTVFAALFAVLLFSSFKAEAQTVEITGQTEFCNYPVVPIYTATLAGGAETWTDPQFAWYFSTDFGVEASGGAEVNQFAVRWNEPTCDIRAYVYVEVRDGDAGALIKSDTLWIYIYDPLPESAYAEIGPFQGCEDAAQIDILGNEPECEVTYGYWTKVDGPESPDFVFDDPESYDTFVTGFLVGTYTLTWTQENGDCFSSVVTTTLTVHPSPEIAIEPVGPVELCYGETIDLVATATNVTTINWYKVNSVPSKVNHSGDEVVATATDTYTVTESGDYYAVGISEFGCGTATSTVTSVDISGLSAVTIATTDELTWHADDTVEVDFAATLTGTPIGGVTYQWYVNGTPEGDDLATFTLSMPWTSGDMLHVFGEYDVWVEVYETIGTESCTLLESNEITVTIVPPIYAMFNPSYIEGDITERPTCLGSVPLDIELWIEFSQEVFDIHGNPLPTNDLGDFVALENWDDDLNGGAGGYVSNSFFSVRTGNKISIQHAEALQYDTQYRLRFVEVYKTTDNADGKVLYTLDLTDDGEDLIFDEDNYDAYVETNYVCFTTMTLQEATLPTVTPTGEDVGLCDEIRVEFVNPVKYLNNNPITDDPSHKFNLQKWTGAAWENVDFTAIPSEYETVVPYEGVIDTGPTVITLVTDQMDYCTEYRVTMNPFEFPDETIGYGFYDLVTGFNLLPTEEVEPWQVQGDLGWTWTTTCTYDITVTFEPLEEVFNLADFNNVTVDGLPVAGLVEGVPAIVTETFTIDYTAGTVTLTADPGEGYHFLRWTKNGVPVYASLDPLVLMGPEWTFDAEGHAPDCDEHNVYKAWFGLNEYMVERIASDEEDGEVTVEGQTINPSEHDHGTMAIWTATPEPGKYVSNWIWEGETPGAFTQTLNYSDFSECYLTPVPENFIISFTGDDLVHGSTYTLTAVFDDFDPWVYATAYGTDDDEMIDYNISDIEFKTLFVENILDTDVEPAGTFDDHEYQAAQFLYGNPRSQTGEHYPVSVRPLNVPCEYEFVMWERAIPTGTETCTWEWVEISTDEEFSFIPTENYRLRAVFEWRTDVMVSVDNDVVVVEDPMAMASFRVTLNDEEEQWFNDPAPKALSPGDVLTIRAFPEPNYMVYGWVDENGDPVEDVVFEGRGLAVSPTADDDESEWTYVVGCEDVNLRAVVGLKRFHVTATATEGGLVENSVPANEGLGEYGYGYLPEDDELGFNVNVDGDYVEGWFELGTEVTFVADAEEDYAFLYWMEGMTTISTDEELIWVVDRNIDLDAIFESTLVVPTWTVTLLDEPVGTGILTGAGEYEEGETVTVTATAEIGWSFVSWTMDDDILSTDESGVYTFTMETDDVTLTANFEQTEYELDLLTRTYMRKNNTTYPYTSQPYRIGENEGVYGGVVEDLTNDGPYVFGDVITLKATPAPGFKLVNWMVGEVIDEDDEVYQGAQVNPVDGTTVYPGDYTFTYEIPAMYEGPVTIHAIFAHASAPQYPVYDLFTHTYPAGFGMTYGDGHYAHGVIAEISEEVTEPGYEFSHWDVVGGTEFNMYASDNLIYMNNGVVNATAHYTATEYTLYVQAISGYGTINNPVANPTTFTIEDDPIRVRTTPLSTNVDYSYVFTGYTYDAMGNIPVTDALGNEVTDSEFFFIPVVPDAYMSDGAHDVTIYAQYDRVVRYYDVTLRTALNTYTNTNEDVGNAWLVDETAPYSFTYDEEIEVMSEPNAGYQFKHWTDASGTILVLEPGFNHTVVANATFIAVYEYIPYELELVAVPEEGGDLAAVPAQDTYHIGEEVTVTATPAAGYAFTGFAEPLPAGAVVDGHEVSFVWGADDVTIVGHFELITYDVTFVVTDPEGAAVTDAVITLDGVTNAAGDYDFTELLPGTYLYTVTLDGYLPIEGEVVVTDDDVTVNVAFEACDVPTGLEAAVTAKTAVITWDAGDADTWWVRVNGGAWTEVTVNERFYTGLMPGTDYLYEVATVCGEGVVSDPAELEFTTIHMGDVNGDDDFESVVNLTMMIAYINGDINEDYVIMDARDYDGQTSVFIFDAADFNSDLNINVLDIVSWVNQTMNAADKADLRSNPADIYLAPGLISLNSDGTLAGIEFSFKGRNLDQVNLEMLLAGYELTWRVNGDVLTGIVYSLNNKPISKGLVEMISVSGGQDIEWDGAFAANLNASLVDVRTHGNITTGIEDILVEMTMEAFPNPSSGQFTTRISTPTSSDVVLRLYDMTGRQISIKQLVVNGQESVVWNEDLRTGMYIMRMIATPENQRDQSVTREVRILINK